VTISIEEVKCVTKEDNTGSDEVYWISNIRCGPAVEGKYLDMTKIYVDSEYSTSLPTMVKFKNGDTKNLPSPVFDRNCPFDAFVYGTIHFMERDTPLSEVFSAILTAIAAIIGGIAGAIGLGVIGGVAYAAITGAAIAAGAAAGLSLGLAIALAAATVAILLALLLAYMKDASGDDNLGGRPIAIGPLLQPPPPDQLNIRLDTTLTPSGELTALDNNGAEIVTYSSSYTNVPSLLGSGHRYEIKMRMDIRGGHT
jgi:hypothetical protein